MATSAKSRKPCSQCDKSAAIANCIGCNKSFCQNHFRNHRSELDTEIDSLIQEHNHLREDISNKVDLTQHPFSSQIDRWEKEAMKKIKLAARKARSDLQEYVNHTVEPIEQKLNDLAEEWKTSRERGEFSETELEYWSEELTELRKQLEKPSTINIEHENIGDNNIPLTMIRVTKTESIQQRSHSLSLMPNMSSNSQWRQNGKTLIGGEKGSSLNRLNYPYAFDMDHQGGFYICDYDNNRIVFWKAGDRTGQLVTKCNGPLAVLYNERRHSLIISEKESRQVYEQNLGDDQTKSVLISNIVCRGLAFDHENCLYVSNAEKHEIQSYSTRKKGGTIVAGGNGQGDGLHQLNCPSRLFIDQDQSIYITDYYNHRIMKWVKGAKEGIIVAGGNGPGNSTKQLNCPRGLWVDSIGSVFVADSENNRIVRWLKRAKEGSEIIGGKVLNVPMGLKLDSQENIYVADSMNFRIVKFELNS